MIAHLARFAGHEQVSVVLIRSRAITICTSSRGETPFKSRRNAALQLIAFRETTLYRQAVGNRLFLGCDSANGQD